MSSGAHCDRTYAIEVQRCSLQCGAGEQDWREAWRTGLARSLAKRIGEEEDWRGGGDGKEEEEEEKEEKEEEEDEEEEEQTALIKSSNHPMAGGEIWEQTHKKTLLMQMQITGIVDCFFSINLANRTA